MSDSSPAPNRSSFRIARAADLVGRADARERREAQILAISALLERLRAYDEPTYRHARSAGLWCRKLAVELGATDGEADFVERCGALHDVGKLGIPLALLQKPAPLSASEWHVVRRHVEFGAELCAEVAELANFAPIVLTHHERFDGTGYPKRLAGEEIPLEAKIVAVADAFHAMISQRGFARTRSAADALAELERGSGSQFDPRVVTAFFRLVGYRGRAAAHMRDARIA